MRKFYADAVTINDNFKNNMLPAHQLFLEFCGIILFSISWSCNKYYSAGNLTVINIKSMPTVICTLLQFSRAILGYISLSKIQNGSFEYPQHKVWFRNKKIIFLYAQLTIKGLIVLIIYNSKLCGIEDMNTDKWKDAQTISKLNRDQIQLKWQVSFSLKSQISIYPLFTKAGLWW